MKTFSDIILESNEYDVIKTYNINGTSIGIQSTHFKDAIEQGKCAFAGKCKYIVSDTFRCEITKPSDIYLHIKIEQDTTTECDACEGSGQHYCHDCDCYHDCGSCEGLGQIFDYYTEPSILVDETINLNQGELF